MKDLIKPCLAFAALLVIAADTMAESHAISNRDNDGYKASARIKLRVVIPEVLLLRINDATSDADTLTFPSSVKVPTANGGLAVHTNSGPAASIATQRGTTAEMTYTAASL